MSTPARVAGFAVLLTLLFVAAFGTGRAFGPVDPVAGDAHASHDDGYRLDLASGQVPAGRRAPIEFTITDASGALVTSYERVHEKLLHLIAVRRDFGAYQHLHPQLGADGMWSIRAPLAPGAWRIVADFTPPGGEPIALGADLTVPGTTAAAPPAPVTSSVAVDGYDVDLAADDTNGSLVLNVSRDGRPVTDLEPHLGAFGHLVVLREGDLAYLHVHPGDHAEATAGPEVTFRTTAPSAGRYRLYFEFRHEGAVHTAAFVTDSSAPAPEGGHDDH